MTGFLLHPRSIAAYGQDFLNSYLRDAAGLRTLAKGADRLYRYPNELKPTLFVSQNSDDRTEAEFMNACGRFVPTIVYVHCQWEYYSQIQQDNLTLALETACIGFTPSTFLTNNMKHKFPQIEWKSIANGVDSKQFYPSSVVERRMYREAMGLDETNKLAVFTGRLESAKGTKTLLSLASIENRDYHLLIQFPASQNVRENEKLFGSYLSFCDEIQKHPKVLVFPDENQRSSPRPVRFADIAVSTSLSEVQPLVLLEALASGIPFVGTNSTPGYADLFDMCGAESNLLESLELVDLPEYLRQGAIARNVDIADSDAISVAKKLHQKITCQPIRDDLSRDSSSEHFLAQGFSIAAYAERFSCEINAIRQKSGANNKHVERVDTVE